MPSTISSFDGDVVVERHRLHAELLGELAHAERLDPALVGEGDGGAQDPLSAEWSACGLGQCLTDLRRTSSMLTL